MALNAIGEAAMRNHRRHIVLAAAMVLTMILAAPTVEAGGAFGLHIGSGGFGVSVGFGDWGVYSNSWADPYWSINFNATLAGYGQWTWVSGLGKVWRPWVAASWRPYTHGRWVSTSYGWTWVAYEPWGYVPHHYGHWAYCSFGWVWVPGYTYTAANVVWVRAGGYVGWYARPPWGWSHAHHGFHHGYRHGYHDGWGNGYHTGYADGWRDARYATYVDWRHFGTENVSRHSVSHRIASNNRIEGLSSGPTRAEIRRRGSSAVPEAQISRRTVTMDGREITIARPEGVAGSIERHAADTVGSALSRQALDNRQPMVQPRRVSGTSDERSSRPAIAARETRSPRIDRSTEGSSSSRSRQPVASSRSTRKPAVESGRSSSRSSESISQSRFGANQPSADARQMRPRRTEEIGIVGDRQSQRAPSASQRQQPSYESRQSSRLPQSSSASQRQQVQARRSVDRNAAPQTDRRAAESRRPSQRSQQQRASRSKDDSDDKDKERTARRRKR
jgi:hypothetical protein